MFIIKNIKCFSYISAKHSVLSNCYNFNLCSLSICKNKPPEKTLCFILNLKVYIIIIIIIKNTNVYLTAIIINIFYVFWESENKNAGTQKLYFLFPVSVIRSWKLTYTFEWLFDLFICFSLFSFSQFILCQYCMLLGHQHNSN